MVVIAATGTARKRSFLPCADRCSSRPAIHGRRARTHPSLGLLRAVSPSCVRSAFQAASAQLGRCSSIADPSLARRGQTRSRAVGPRNRANGDDGCNGCTRRSLAFVAVHSRSSKSPQTAGFGERERTGANGRQRLPCRRSWVRVPSSASRSPCKPSSAVVCAVNEERLRGKVQPCHERRGRPTSPLSSEFASARRKPLGHESPVNQGNRSPIAYSRLEAPQTLVNAPAASHRRQLQKVIRWLWLVALDDGTPGCNHLPARLSASSRRDGPSACFRR
jgi:hypothetical protein